MKNLVIVESPTKARTLAKFLGDQYQIEASMGHVRDLPRSDIGVDTENNFEPRYIIPKDKSKRINQLKKTLGEAKTLWLATDPDREGEAIAWHLAELAKSVKGKAGSEKQEIKRVEFHEITEDAIRQAFKEPRGIDFRLVDAQQARRVLDRLVGYKLSPLLWKKIKSGLSAGRVQSVALRLIVEREKEIKAFIPVEYWSIEAELSASAESAKSASQNTFVAALIQLNGKKLEVKDKAEADTHVNALEKAVYSISEVNKKETKRYPSPPFTTSTLQQTASNKLGFTSKKTMMLAQNLYEQGMITYMRTDSVNLAPVALSAARELIKDVYGDSYVPAQSRVFKTKSKSAQEAHEAIRPTNVRIKGEDLGTMNGVTRDHMRLYDLIWKRMMASQMSEAVLDQTSISVSAKSAESVYQLRATGSVIKFDGWLKVYGVKAGSVKRKAESEEDEDNEEEKILPELEQGQHLDLVQLSPDQHFTEPQPRYTEASLIKKLEELGIGRPSTYAPTISTIQERFYIERVERKFVPTDLGTTVVDFLVDHFPDIVDYSFTAEMEEKLDEVARGEIKWQPTIEAFYKPFSAKVDSTLETAERVKLAVETVDEQCPDCGKQLLIKHGKFGKFLACSGFPDCKFTKAYEEKIDVKCPKCEGDIIIKRTKKGKPFYGCSKYPKCDFASWNRPGPSGNAAPAQS
jgi:DNA topoisomerase I